MCRVQVSVGVVSRDSEGGGPSSPSPPASRLSLSLLVSGHESNLRRRVGPGTAALHDSLPAGCASSTAAYTGQTETCESHFTCHLYTLRSVLGFRD